MLQLLCLADYFFFNFKMLCRCCFIFFFLFVHNFSLLSSYPFSFWRVTWNDCCTIQFKRKYAGDGIPTSIDFIIPTNRNCRKWNFLRSLCSTLFINSWRKWKKDEENCKKRKKEMENQTESVKVSQTLCTPFFLFYFQMKIKKIVFFLQS